MSPDVDAEEWGANDSASVPNPSGAMTRAEVLQRIRAHLATELQVDADAIGEETRFREDLEADSLDLVELTVELEDHYGIRIPDDQAAKILTVGQAADFVSAHVEDSDG